MTTLEAIRTRLRERLKRRSMDAKALAELTGRNVRTVQGYVSAEGRSIPADFIADCETAGFASGAWMLTGRGSPDVIEPSDALRKLSLVQAIVCG